MVSPNGMYAEILRNDLYGFTHKAFRELHPTKEFLPAWHVELMAAKLEAVARGEIRRLIINVPPRHLKSFLTTVAFPAWLLGLRPATHIITASYQLGVSEGFALETEKIMTLPFYRAVFGTKIGRTKKPLEAFATTEGGAVLPTSPDSALTSLGGDIVIIDDPLSAEQANSELRREKIKRWYSGTAANRFDSPNKGIEIVVSQRLNVDDLVGHLEKSGSWDVLSLPLVSEEDEAHEFKTAFGLRRVQRAAGEILLPAQISPETVTRIRASLTDYNWSAQYQQRPQPTSGNIIKRDWLRYYTGEELPKSFDRVVQSWDTAQKDIPQACPSVCTTWGVAKGRAYLLHVFRDRLDFPDLRAAVKRLIIEHHPTDIVIEEQSSGISLEQDLGGSLRAKIHLFRPGRDSKQQRLRAQSGRFQDRLVLLPAEAPWLDEYVSELISFPNSHFADQVDSTTQALEWIFRNNEPSLLEVLRQKEQQEQRKKDAKVRITGPKDAGMLEVRRIDPISRLPQARPVFANSESIYELTEEEAAPYLKKFGWRRVLDDEP